MSLYEKTNPNEYPTYTISELNTAFQRLQQEFGNCTEVFKKYGIKIELCRVVKSFTQAVERRAISVVEANPQITQSGWSDTVFAEFLEDFPESRYADMFSALTQSQLNIILIRVIYWNPLPYNESRTFDDFVIGMVPGTVRAISREVTSKPKRRRTKKKSVSS